MSDFQKVWGSEDSFLTYQAKTRRSYLRVRASRWEELVLHLQNQLF
ncbi:MAG: hypothetical protein QW318_08300 [Candidatus Caldarchaeum sp.]